jgi:hypothetical protein
VFVVKGVNVKFNVTMLSQPAALMPVHVAVLFEAV